MLHFVTSYMKQDKSRKQTLESAQNRLEIIFKFHIPGRKTSEIKLVLRALVVSAQKKSENKIGSRFELKTMPMADSSRIGFVVLSDISQLAGNKSTTFQMGDHFLGKLV